MRKIVLIGGGGHCKSVLDTIIELGEYGEIVIVDEKALVGTQILGHKIVGTDEDLPKLYEMGYTDAFITVGSIKNTDTRRRLWQEIVKIGFSIMNIIDISASIASGVKLGRGIFIGKHAIVNADASIGDMSIINTNATVEHECVIGEFVHISVGAVLCGNVVVGNDSFVGANATVIQGVILKEKTIVRAGSLITKTSGSLVNNSKYGGGGNE